MSWTDHTGPVPHRSPEELRAAAQAHADATRDRRRRAGTILASLVVLVAGLSVAVARTGEPGPSTEVRAASEGSSPTPTPASPTTAASVASTTTVSPLPPAPPTTATAEGGTPTTLDSVEVSTTTTTTTASCRDSFDPVCGPLVWDPPAGLNRPLAVSISASPSAPRVGEGVKFLVVGDDPDGPVSACITYRYGDESVGGACLPAACPPQYGPWTPVVAPGHLELTFDHVYAAPGSYVARFHFTGLACEGSLPYASSGSSEITVVVGP
ncbi:MAG: hypothetical protein ABR540_20220 [Acidimicrobiales bacterium]